MHKLTNWIFNTTILEMSFYCKKPASVGEFVQNSLWKIFL
jgi:hypothetical protein